MLSHPIMSLTTADVNECSSSSQDSVYIGFVFGQVHFAIHLKYHELESRNGQ